MYRRAADEHGYTPYTADTYDDLIVKYTQTKNVKASQLRLTIPSIEFIYPRIKGHLKRSKQHTEAAQVRTPVC